MHAAVFISALQAKLCRGFLNAGFLELAYSASVFRLEKQ
jgi:hypothetical protein